MDKENEKENTYNLSYESDGEMGKDEKDPNRIKKMIPTDLFFNNTPDSE